jgi:hypothetical protein
MAWQYTCKRNFGQIVANRREGRVDTGRRPDNCSNTCFTEKNRRKIPCMGIGIYSYELIGAAKLNLAGKINNR